MHRISVLTLLLLATPLLHAQAPAKKELLADQVKNAIDRGVRYLRNTQLTNGSWEKGVAAEGMEGGWTGLAVLALLNSGLPATDPTVERGLKFLRTVEPTHTNQTYVKSLQTMAFAEAKLPEDRQRIQENVRWLLENRVYDEGRFLGWGYKPFPIKELKVADNSNTQFAVLALWYAKQAGFDIRPDVWREIREFYLRTQSQEGGWNYAPDLRIKADGNTSSITMTAAGLSGLTIAGMELNEAREELLDDGTARNCGIYREQNGMTQGLDWLTRHFKIELRGRTYYNLYGLERAGRLSGQRFFGPYDWYREGAKYLVGAQRADGSWLTEDYWDRWPQVSTGLALLFLSKGRTPVLVSKLVHGDWPRKEADLDWNNDRNDLRHLVDFASKNLFKGLPLAWQTFDMSRALHEQTTEEAMQEVTSELLQSPIAYITGHKSPLHRFTASEKNLLKRYVDNGGFILAEACCGSPDFDRGFRSLVGELWPDRELEPLPPEHPVWTAFHRVIPGNPYKLYGLSGNCKTVLIYSPVDLSCKWESNRLKDGLVLQAFHLGDNIIAYATGMEPPRPRLTKIEVASNRDDPPAIPRGYFKAAQVKIPGEPRPAPRALRNLLEFVNREAGLDVSLKVEDRFVSDKSAVDYKFLYMHGRGEFRFDPDDLASLRFNLQNGGLLFADACCGKEPFDQSFRKFAKDLFPQAKLEPVPLNDVLFSKELNETPLTEANIRCRQKVGGDMLPCEPFLEGIKHEGRWVVLYSKYDIGCALEGHKASDCRGYDRESAQMLGRAAVLYTLRP